MTSDHPPDRSYLLEKKSAPMARPLGADMNGDGDAVGPEKAAAGAACCAEPKGATLGMKLEALADGHRRCLEERYGFTLVDVSFAIDAEAHRLAVAGEVLVEKILTALEARIRSVLPAGWDLCTRQLAVISGNEWRECPRDTPVYQAHPSHDRICSTYHAANDGPVQVVTSHEGAILVKLMDGTRGWVSIDLGAEVPPPVIACADINIHKLQDTLRSYIGSPYRTGGTTIEGIDCSGLVQRCFREACGLLLPRHSTDQLLVGGPAVSDHRHVGALVFTPTTTDNSWHVGVIVDGEPTSVIHASTTRKEVVEDSLEQFTQGALSVRFVALDQLVQFGARTVGRDSIALGAAWHGHDV